MNDREKLVELIKRNPYANTPYSLADHLLANGVTVQKSHCPFCGDNGGGHGRMKHSYDDEDGMTMSIHPSHRNENGNQSEAWWATVYFRGESRDFYIEVCPFCGRRLVPFREEAEAALKEGQE